MVFLSRKPKGIARVLAEAGGSGLLVFAFFANLGEGYATARIASDGGNMLDAIVARDFGATRGNFFAILAFIGLLAVSIFLKDSLLGQYLENGMARLRKKTVESLGKTRMSWLDGHHTGQLSARVMADLAALSGALRPVLIMGISVVVYNCVALAFMFMTDWLLTLIVFSIAPATALLQWFSSHPIREYRKANQEAVGALSSVVFDCFGNFESVKSLALEDEMRGRFNAAQERQVDAAVKETRVIAGLTVFSGIGKFLPRLALLLAGGIFVINGRMTLGQLSMFIYLSGGVVRVVGNMANLIGSIRQLTANADRIVALWDAPKEKSGGFSEAPAALSGADCEAPAPFPETAIRFENVSFKYGDGANCGANDGADDILADVSFDVPKGAFVALVGESGCGKSTAMKLAAALYEPKKGSIRELGRDIGEWDVSALRSRIAYVAQDAYLFPVSLADNIRAGSPAGEGPEAGASLEECVKIAQLARFAESLPKGLETDAGERGVFLSGGQKQRISIARALYKKAELLFLDEATSALDRATEEAVLRGILSMKDRPTLVAITHSLANVRNADKIIVFSGGRTRETGTHDVLLARNGEYARLLARQESRIEA